jgi:hypothetical protein
VASHRFGNSFYRYLLASGRIFGFGEYGFKRFFHERTDGYDEVVEENGEG